MALVHLDAVDARDHGAAPVIDAVPPQHGTEEVRDCHRVRVLHLRASGPVRRVGDVLDLEGSGIRSTGRGIRSHTSVRSCTGSNRTRTPFSFEATNLRSRPKASMPVWSTPPASMLGVRGAWLRRSSGGHRPRSRRSGAARICCADLPWSPHPGPRSRGTSSRM